MRSTVLNLYVKTAAVWRALGGLLTDHQGQDLIEYALVVALIAFAAAAGMTSVATQINAAFTSVGAKVSAYTS